MTELEKILYTAAATIIGGVFIFVIGQLLSKFIIEPIYEQRNVIGVIADDLIFYSRLYVNPGPIRDRELGTIKVLPEQTEAEDALRQHASKLMARTQAIPLYWLWEKLKLVRSKANIAEAHKNLIYLSNSIVQGDRKENKMSRTNIVQSLGFKDLFPNA
jgi:hypothetical protein